MSEAAGVETEASRMKDLASISWHSPTGRPVANVVGWLEVGKESYLELLGLRKEET